MTTNTTNPVLLIEMRSAELLQAIEEYTEACEYVGSCHSALSHAIGRPGERDVRAELGEAQAAQKARREELTTAIGVAALAEANLAVIEALDGRVG